MAKKDEVEILVSKHIEDLRCIDDVLFDPRSWSPDDLKEACNNVRFDTDQVIDEFANLTIQFLIKNFFFLQHQTGLYNPQKKLWSLLAQVKKIKLKSYTKLRRKDRDKAKISDIIIEDNNARFIHARLVYPNSELQFPAFNDLLSNISSKCVGLFYISDQDGDEKTIKRIKEKTNAEDFYDKYKSPITKNCSLNLIKYKIQGDKLIYNLVHPDLSKNVEAELCLVHS